MQEAKFSLNVKFNYKGYDSQFTMRDDTDGKMLPNQFSAAIKLLEQLGAVPDRRWEGVRNGNGSGNGNGNGHTTAAAVTVAAAAAKQDVWQPPTPRIQTEHPVCRHCDSSDHMELVEFFKDGQKKAAFKCLACDKWHWEKKEK